MASNSSLIRAVPSIAHFKFSRLDLIVLRSLLNLAASCNKTIERLGSSPFSSSTNSYLLQCSLFKLSKSGISLFLMMLLTI